MWSTDPFAERWIAPNGDTSTSQFFGDHHYYNYAADSQSIATMVSPRYALVTDARATFLPPTHTGAHGGHHGTRRTALSTR